MFPMTGEKMTIGRSPETSVFLDDVTVSREHATLGLLCRGRVHREVLRFIDEVGTEIVGRL